MLTVSSPSRLVFDKVQAALAQGRFTEAKALAAEGREAARRRKDLAGEALLIVAQAQVTENLTGDSEVLPRYQEGLALARQAKDPFAEANAQLRIGSFLKDVGQVSAAATALQAGLALTSPLSEPDLLAKLRTEYAALLAEQDKTDLAKAEFQRAIALFPKCKPEVGIYNLVRYSRFLTGEALYDEAKAQLLRAQSSLKQTSFVLGEILLAQAQARLAMALNQPERAFPLLNTARRKARALAALRVETKVALTQADIYDDLDQHESTIKAAQEALVLARKSGARLDEALGHLFLSYGLYGAEKYQEALSEAKRCLEIGEATKISQLQARALLSLGTSAIRLAKTDEAIALAERGLALVTEDAEARSALESLLVGAYLQDGKSEKARTLLQAALSRTNSPSTKLSLIERIAATYFAEKKYAEVITSTEELEALARLSGNKASEGSAWRLRAGALDALAKSTEALAALEHALALFREGKDQAREAESLGAIALLHTKRESYALAEDVVRKCSKLYQALGQPAQAGRCVLTVAYYWLQKEKFAAAERVLEELLPVVRSAKLAALEATTLHYLGSIQAHDENYDKSLESLEKALVLYQEVKDRANEAHVLRGLAALLGQRGEEERAREYLEKAKAIEATLG